MARWWAIALVMSLAISSPAMAVEAVFEGQTTTFQWPVSQLNAQIPSDWSGFDYLVLEFRASSSQRFELGLQTPDKLITKRIHPFAGVWVRASVPLKFYRQPPGNGVDLAATMNQPRSSYWINIEDGGHGPVGPVSDLVVTMHDPVGRATLEIRSISLAKEDPGDAVLDNKPLIDEFGQYIPVDWPGKAKSLADLKSAWAAEDTQLQTPLPGRDRFGGFLDSHGDATGFFHVQQIDGRWWFVDPDGHLFFSTGANGVGTFVGTHTQGRADLFTSLPAAVSSPFPGAPPMAGSYYTANLQRRFGDNWRPQWAQTTLRRFDAWGLNTLTGRDPVLLRAEPRKPYVTMWATRQVGATIMGMPDVYSADFARLIDASAARQLTPLRDDPYLIGYFVGNEPPWPGREQQLVQLILAGPDSAMKTALTTYLANGDTPDRRKQFVLDSFAKYLDTVVAAGHKYAPHHLDLGIRFGGRPPDEVIKLAHVFDVYSHNIYSYAPDDERLDRYYALTGRPILIGEFHIGAPERGLASGLVQAANQHERGVAYQYFMEHAAANPAVIGAHWFEWIDEPATGRSDGENYNIGMIDVTDQPYAELVAAMKQTHQRLLKVHAGTEPPTDQKAKAQ
jgi:hypothetical protein